MNDGIILLDKEAGVTSRKVDNLIQRKFAPCKAGHLGTLDPFATGLLIVGVNKGGKYFPYLPDGKKTYVATLKLGVKTTTGDIEGEVEELKSVPPLTKREIECTLSLFLGKSMQIPPMTSAIKVDGCALYKLAHKGKEVERKPREIEIEEIKLLSYEKDEITFEATVSKGTYVRVLGEDIAAKLGTVGYLTALRRVKIGDISVIDAVKMEEVNENSIIDPTPYVALPHVEVNSETKKKVENGVKLPLKEKDVQVLLTCEGKSLAVYEKKEDGLFHSVRGLF